MSIKIKLEGDSKNFKKSMEEARKSSKKLGKEIEKTSKQSQGLFKRMGNSLRNLAGQWKKGLLAITAAVGAMGFAFKKAVDAASQIETINTRFEVLTGSAEKAKQHVKELLEFSASTPFQFSELAESSALLQAFGVGTDIAIGKLREIGDVAAATGKPVKELAVIYGQVAAAGKLTGERLLQLQERGVPVLTALAKHFDVTKGRARELVTEGRVTTEVFEKVFATMSSEGGFAFGGMEKQSKTLAGQISTLKDNFFILASKVGEAALPVVKRFTGRITELVKSLGDNSDKFDSLKKFFQDVGKYAGEAAGVVGKVVTGTRAIFHFLTKDVAEGISNLADKITGEDKRIANMKKKYGDQIVSDDQIMLDALARQKEEADAKQAEIDAKKTEQAKLRREAELEAKRIAQENEDEHERRRLRGKLQQDIFYHKQGFGALKKFNELTKKEKQVGFDNIARLAKSENKIVGSIGKAASVRNVAMKGYESVMSAYAFGSGIGGPILGGVLAAAAGAFAAEQAAGVAGVQLYDGGTVLGRGMRGASMYRDSVPATLAVGETVVSRKLTEKIANMADNQGVSNYDNRTSVMIEGNVILDDDERIDQLVERINTRVEDGNLRLVSSDMRK